MRDVVLMGSVLLALATAVGFSACGRVESEDPGRGSDEGVGEAPQATQVFCHWAGATVEEGEWLECQNCVWRYCQCLHTGQWGHCTNTEPPQGACDWTHPDWTNPACSEGGTLPCDWTHPDWQNPACQSTPPPGGGQACTTCHTHGVPQGTPPPHIHTWLP
jgi:hypothetical protein